MPRKLPGRAKTHFRLEVQEVDLSSAHYARYQVVDAGQGYILADITVLDDAAGDRQLAELITNAVMAKLEWSRRISDG